MKRFHSNKGKSATIELAHPKFDPDLDVFWVKVLWPDGRIYRDTVFFTEGKAEKFLSWIGNVNHEEWTEI